MYIYLFNLKIYFLKRSKATRYRRRKRAALYLESLFSSSSDENFENSMTSVFPSVPPPVPLVTNAVNINNIKINTDHIDHTTSSSIESNIDDISSSNSFDDQSISVVEENEDIELTIAKWAVRNSICHSVLDDLLVSLSKHTEFKHLPKDSRTLLHTPSSTILKNIDGGVYYHFGIVSELEYLCKVHTHLPSTLLLMVGIDGLPVTKNPPSQLWPILGYFSNIPDKKHKVFIIGAYYGKSKPGDCNEYMQDFVDELCLLINKGVTINNITIKVLLNAIICDTPAKSFVLNIRGHTAKKSCLRCQTIGQFENNRVYFPDLTFSLRTHDDFVAYTDSDFHYGETVLSKLPKFDIINNIPYDYMHSVCIGIMKKILIFWTGGVKKHNLALPKKLISVLDSRLNNLGQHIPHEFQRAPNENSRKHPIHDASRLKATELRQILLYTGMVIFHKVISEEVYNHFLEFCIAIRILFTNNITSEYNKFAKSLILHFVASFAQIYQKCYMSHNMHSILHLSDDVEKFGPLNSFSAFPFESYMQPLKKKIKSGVKPLQQLVRRYAEEKILWHNQKLKPENCNSSINYQCKIKNRPLIENSCDPQFTGWKMPNFVLKLNKADNCVKMQNNDIVVIENIATSKCDNSVVIIGRKFSKLTNFFEKPLLSHLLNIYSASNLSNLQSWKLNTIKEKMMCLPLTDIDSYVILPLLHLQ